MKALNNKLRVQPILNKQLAVEFKNNEKEHKQQQQSFFCSVPIDVEQARQLGNNEQAVLLHNLGEFTALLEGWSKASHNCNDITQFAKVPILSEGWCYGKDTRISFQGFAPIRNTHIESITKLNKFISLFMVVDFCQAAPILFNRDWKIIDGYHRWWAINNLPDHTRKRFYFVQLDL